MLAKNAVQKPDTLNPLTSDDTSKIIRALMTRRNKPKVRKVSGKVSTMSSGLTRAFAKPSNSAEKINDEVLANRIPLKSRLAAHSDTAVMVQCRKNDVMLSSLQGWSRKCFSGWFLNHTAP